MLPIDNSNRQPQPPPPPPSMMIQSNHPGAVAYRLYDGSLQNSMIHQSLAPNTPLLLGGQPRKRPNREESPKSDEPSSELEHQDSRNPVGGAATKKPRKDYEWIYITGEACHSIRQVNGGLDLTHTKKKYRNMKCLYCAEYNASTPWATLKPRKYETENLVDHENSSHHRKAVAARNIALGISTGNASSATGMDENGMLDHKGLKANLLKGGFNTFLEFGGGGLLHHPGNPNSIMHLNPNPYLLQQAQLQQQPHLQQDMRMFEFQPWAIHQSNMMSQHQQQTQGTSGLQHPYGVGPEHLSWPLEGSYHQQGNLTLPPPPVHHLLPPNRAMNQLLPPHPQQLSHLHPDYPMQQIISVMTSNSSSNGNQPQSNNNGNRFLDYSPAAAMYPSAPSKLAAQQGGGNSSNNNSSSNNGNNNSNGSNNNSSSGGNLNNGNGNQQLHTGNTNNNLISNDQMVYLNYGNSSQGYQVHSLPLQSNPHHSYPTMASMNLGSFTAPFLTAHATAAAAAAGQFNQMNHANNAISSNPMLSNYSSSNPPVEQSTAATGTTSSEHFQRPKGRYSPMWLHVQGKFCFSDRQVTTGKDLSKTKKKYRLVLCLYCAEFLPNTPWASLKPRKFETAVFIEHERSLNHKKAEELKKHKEQQEKGGDQPLPLSSDEQGGRYTTEQEEEGNEEQDEHTRNENDDEEEEEGNDDGSAEKPVNILMTLYGHDSDSEKEEDEEEEQERVEGEKRMAQGNIPYNTRDGTDHHLTYSDENRRFAMNQPLPPLPSTLPDSLPDQTLQSYGRRDERPGEGMLEREVRTNSFPSNTFDQDSHSYGNNDVIEAASFAPTSSSSKTEDSTLSDTQPLVIEL